MVIRAARAPQNRPSADSRAVRIRRGCQMAGASKA